MRDQQKLSEVIKIRSLSVEDFEAVLLWNKDEAFCSANGWALNRSPKDIYSWWLDCVSKDTSDFARLRIEYEDG